MMLCVSLFVFVRSKSSKCNKRSIGMSVPSRSFCCFSDSTCLKTQKYWSNKNAVSCILYYLAVVFSFFFSILLVLALQKKKKKKKSFKKYKISPYRFFFLLLSWTMWIFPWNYVVLSYKYSFTHSFILLPLFLVHYTMQWYFVTCLTLKYHI